MFALVDCNNFFVSCERVFQPQLKEKPVVVLSNNDGCIVSRSQEAKGLGIPMAGAYFKVRYLAEKHGVVAFSSNFNLYADLSRRVRYILDMFCARVEYYSVDECFLEFPDTKNDIEGLGREIIDRVYRWTGIPVSVGFASTKTLAKVATDRAKKDPIHQGVYSLVHRSSKEVQCALQAIPVTDVWGIGHRQGPFLLQQGIKTADDLRNAPEWLIRKYLTVHGARTVRELRGEVCYPIAERRTKKSIASTRSFRRYITTERELAEAIANYTAQAAARLRTEKSHARRITVYIRTNFHNKQHPQYQNSTSCTLAVATDSTQKLLQAALQCLKGIYQEGYSYQKAGVILSHIEPAYLWQSTLWQEDHRAMERDTELMRSLDRVNQKWGKNTVFLARQGVRRTWTAREEKKSANFTTSWQELLSVNIG